MALNTRIPLLVTIAAGLVLTAGCSDGSTTVSDSAAAGISTQAVGTVTATPDTATVVLGVDTQAANANDALSANADRATALIDTLKSKGVAAEDLTTSGLSVSPTYAPTSMTITGYQVSNQVTATVHDVTQAGPLIDAAAAAAGDAVRVQSLTFSIGDDSDMRAQAREKAVQQAQTQAKQIADAAGVKLGGVRSITEVAAGTPAPINGRVFSDQASTATPVEPGTQDMTVTVAVVYDIG